jgi:hypothetical protein
MQEEKLRVSDVADLVLARQARVRAERTGEPSLEALEAVLETEAGQQLVGLRDGTHRNEEAQRWQDELAPKRAKKRNQSRQEDSRQEDYRKVRVNDEDYREHQSAIRHRRSSLR